MKRLLSLIGLFFLLMGCTNNPPKVKQVWWLPVLSINKEGTIFQRELILYVHAQDEEGEADLAQLRLENPEKEIYWIIDHTLWSKWETPGETWIGSSHIKGDPEFLFTGAYRLILEDRGGRTGEIALYLEGWPSEDLVSKQLITPLGDDKWQIESEYDSWMIINSQGELIPCPINRPFVPRTLAGEGEYSYILFNKEKMWQIRRGPYN